MNLDPLLTQLENAQLLHRLGESPDLVYVFKHVLTQEAAYESLLAKNRREIHRRVARAYEEIYAIRCQEEFAAILAEHYAAAGDAVKTFEYAIRAGDAAARLYANAEAIMHYSRALEVAPRSAPITSQQLTHLYLQRGRALELNGQYEGALANYIEMESVARGRSDRALELAALMARGTIHAAPTAKFDPPQGRALSEQALPIARELGDRKAEAKILWNLMLLTGMTGHQSEAVQYGEQSIAIARELNLREQLAFALNDIYRAYAANGQLERGKSALEEAREIWRELGNMPMLADSLSASTLMHFYAGEYDQALAFSGEALRISESIGNLWGQSFSRLASGFIHFEHGEPEKAITTMEDCIRYGKQAGFIVVEIWTRSDLAWVYASLGAIDRGLELARLARAKAEAQFQTWRPFAHAVLARLYLLDGNLPEAEASLKRAEDTLNREEFIWGGEFLWLTAGGEMALAKKDFTRAVSVADELIAKIRKHDFRIFLPEALFLKGIALVSQNKMDEASENFSLARAEAEALDSRRTLWPILVAQSELESQRGNQSQAHALRDQAREIVEYIAEHSPPDLRVSFLNLPRVRALIGDLFLGH